MSNVDKFSRGVLYSKKSAQNYALTRVKPIAELSALIETFWYVEWNLCDGQSHVQQNIPDPCINLTFEANRARVVGAVTGRYTAKLNGKGSIFGIKFHPGGFHALTEISASYFTDKSIELGNLLGRQGHELSNTIIGSTNIESMIEAAEMFFLTLEPKSLTTLEKTAAIIHEIKLNSDITRVDQLSKIFSTSERSLQRLFKDNVGVSPKWTIRKHRMQEVLSMMENGEHNWQQLVSQLDYFDQSHFINDFKSLVGVTPARYIEGLKSES